MKGTGVINWFMSWEKGNHLVIETYGLLKSLIDFTAVNYNQKIKFNIGSFIG